MTMKELRAMSDEELRELSFHCACRDDLRTCKIIADVIKFYHKTVKVVKGRKVPKFSAWQRHLNSNGKYAAKKVLEILKDKAKEVV